MFEPATADWTVVYFSATRGNVVSLRGRPDGEDIEIVGESRRGDSLRWRFFEITDDTVANRDQHVLKARKRSQQREEERGQRANDRGDRNLSMQSGVHRGALLGMVFRGCCIA